MKTYDLVVRDGMVVDGSGAARYRADVGVKEGRIAHIGRIAKGSGARDLDAEGHIVSPGFVDGHTHMDAQIFWDPIGSSSCYHGVTTAIMGCRCINDASLSSASATRYFPAPRRALLPALISCPPITKVGSSPPSASTLAMRLVVVVLPWVPATAIA